MATDLSKIPTSELEALKNNDLKNVSTETLEYLRTMAVGTGAPPASQTQTGDNTQKPPANTQPPQGFIRSIPGHIRNIVNSPNTSLLLEGVGAIGGGMAGAPGGAPGMVAGAALGAGLGQEIASGLKGEVPKASDTINAMVTGAAGEMGGPLVSKIAQKATGLFKGAPEWLYRKSLKVPTGKFDTLHPGYDATARQSMIKEGMEAGIVPGKEEGMVQARNTIEELKEAVNREVKGLTQMTPAAEVKAGLGEVKANAWASGDYKTAKEAVDTVEKEITRQAGTRSEFTPDGLNRLKIQFHDEVDWLKNNPIVDVKGQFTKEAKMGAANAAMLKLEEMSPNIRYLNKKSGAYIDLMKALENTVKKEADANPVRFGSKVLALKSTALAVLDSLFVGSANKARLAFALKKGAQAARKHEAWLSRTGGYAGAREMKSETEGGNTIIRYDQNGMRMTQ